MGFLSIKSSLLCSLGLFLSPLPSLSPDSVLSRWTVEVDLFFDVTAASVGVVHVSIPQLQSEAKFPLSLTPEQSNTSIHLQINQVNKSLYLI